MRLVRSLWSACQGDARFMRRLNAWLTIFWVAMIPISYSFGWLRSVTFVSALSLWALVAGHWSTWQAARVEVAQQEQIKEEHNHPVEKRVVEEIVRETDVDRSPGRAASRAGNAGAPPRRREVSVDADPEAPAPTN